MANQQAKSGKDVDRTGPLSRIAPSVREGERLQIMDDGTHMSLNERLDYAVKLIPRAEWQTRIGRSARQIDRYLKDADIPFSVLNMISVASGVPKDWLAAGTPTYGPSESDRWREEIDPDNHAKPPGYQAPANLRKNSQVTETIDVSDEGRPNPSVSADFRLRSLNPEVPSITPRGALRISNLTNFVMVPRYDVRAAAGRGSEVEMEPLMGYLALDEDFLRAHIGRPLDRLVTIEATGDSMAPTIRDGSLLIVDISVRDIDDGRIYVLDVDGRLLVKRLQVRADSRIIIRSDNAAYEPEIITPSEATSLHIIGQVVYQAGPVRS